MEKDFSYLEENEEEEDEDGIHDSYSQQEEQTER